MKKFPILFVILLFPVLVVARSTLMIGGGTPAAGGGGPLISDNFGSDTTANYTDIRASNGMTITSGAAVGEGGVWGGGQYCYESAHSMGSANHYVQASLKNSANGSGIIIRCNGNGTSSTGYVVYGTSTANTVYFGKFSAPADVYPTLIDQWACTWAANAVVTVRVEVNAANLFTIKVGGVTAGTVTDTSYTGNYVGMYWYHNGATIPTDNLEASTL